MVEPVSGIVAARLTNGLLGAATRRLRETVLGSEEQQAIERAFQLALSVMIAELSVPRDGGPVVELESPLLDFVSQIDVANALLDMAIKHQEPPIDRLRDRYY